MAKATWTLMAGVMMASGLAVAARPAAAADMDAPAASRVRSSNPIINERIREAAERSKTFRGLVETINASDGIVYVEEGSCFRGVRACFTSVTTAGSNRVLLVKIETYKKDERDLMESIGHELRHTIEVLGDPKVASQAALFFFYERVGKNGSGAFETDAAVRAGRTVREEVRKSGRRSGN